MFIYPSFHLRDRLVLFTSSQVKPTTAFCVESCEWEYGLYVNLVFLTTVASTSLLRRMTLQTIEETLGKVTLFGRESESLFLPHSPSPFVLCTVTLSGEDFFLRLKYFSMNCQVII